MAKRTNKTDHVLNLLSQGKKSSSAAPPVQLKKAESEEPALEPAEAAAPAQEDGQRGAPQQQTAAEKEPSQEQGSAAGASSAEPKEIPQVSVVHTSSEENPIAESVKDALEAELEDYLKENPNLPDLPDLPQETETEKAESLPDLPESPAEPLAAGQGDQEVTSTPGTEGLPDVPDLSDTPETSEPLERDTSVKAEPAASSEVPAEPTLTKEAAVPEPPVTIAESDTLESQETQTKEAEEPASNTASDPEPTAAPAQPPAAQTAPQEVEKPEMAVSSEPAAPQESQPDPTSVQSPKPSVAAPEQDRAATVEETPQQESAPVASTESAGTPAPGPQKEEEPDFATVNVMEYLVREQAPKYIRQFGHCDCSRCIEDTIALSLTHLPAKYVVVNKNAVSPLLNFYEKRFAGQLIVEITKASMIVDESPHH